MISFICVDLKTGDGGFLIPKTEASLEIVDELLKDPRYILKGEAFTKSAEEVH